MEEKTSPSSIAPADADGDRLLADRDMEEAGQLARAEALLDLLLEMPDEEHLPEEVAQPLLRERPPLALDLCHGAESMLSGMTTGATTVGLARQWRRLQTTLPEDWAHARLSLTPTNSKRLDRAAALLGPLTPGRAGETLRLEATRGGQGNSAAAVGRALSRLDAERIRGTLELIGALDVAPAGRQRPTPAVEDAAAADGWDALVAGLPEDWSDVYAQVELTSSDHLDPAALALAPINPARYDGSPGFRFRCARTFGYGAAPGMVRRCLARLDERDIDATVSILRVLSDTKPVGSQGPVWYVGGKVV